MGKISDTSKYPVVTPTGTDILIGTDVGSSNATKNFTVASINALANSYPLSIANGGTGASLSSFGDKRQVLTSDGTSLSLKYISGPVISEVTSTTGTYNWNLDLGDTLNITLTNGVTTTLTISSAFEGDEGTLIVNGAGGNIVLPNPGSKIKGASYSSANGRQDLLTFKYVDSKFHWIATTDLVTYTP